MRRYGVEGRRLSRLSRGQDVRSVNPDRETKSVSAETTFNTDIRDYTALERILWSLSEKVSRRMKKQELAGSTVNVKLKTSDFKIRTRAASLSDPTQLAARIFETGRELLKREADGTSYRLIGIGVSALVPASDADPANLMDRRSVDAEHAVDRLRAKFGDAVVVRGLAFDKEDDE
jgi:DNA polymerase-4